MNRATELDFSCWMRLAVVPFVAVISIGCAAPIVPPTNLIVDADLRDCSTEIFDAIGPLDVAIVIDTSQSTGRPTGFDIDEDGQIHNYKRNSRIDRADSWLAAQIAGVRPLLRSAEGHNIRFSIVTFAGTTVSRSVGRSQLIASVRNSRIRSKLTGDLAKLDSVLVDIFEGGSDGTTLFSAGMQRATRSLLTSRSASVEQPRRRVVLLMSDARSPNGLDAGGDIKNLDPRMKSAAVIAQGHRVIFHTFGLSPDLSLWRPPALAQIAGATGGTYHLIEDPTQLYCHLSNSLLPTKVQEQRKWQAAFARYREQQGITSGAVTTDGVKRVEEPSRDQ
jgi:hypothetical protein